MEHTDEKNYGHLTHVERQEIQEQHTKGYGVRAIARMLGRDPASISRELKRNIVNDAYVATKANTKSWVRRKASKYQGKRIVANTALQHFIERALMQRQSPQAIAGRLKAGLEPGLPYVSRDTIETYIRSEHGRRIEYQLKVLKAGQKKRNKPRRPGQPPQQGDPKKSIDDRPAFIVNRERAGDLEVDFIVSGKQGTGYCLTAADRRLRIGFIRKLLPVTVGNALAALKDIKRQFPELTSITTDNDILWRFHTQLEVAPGVPFYFCDSYASWQKGSVENYNGQARKFIKKGSDISQYGEVYIATVETKLNNRYMEVLGYKTPKEALDEYRRDL